MTPETRRASIRLLQHLADFTDRDLHSLASVVARRRIADVADMTPDEIGRLACALNLEARDDVKAIRRTSQRRINDYTLED
jgi:hypothetical protein